MYSKEEVYKKVEELVIKFRNNKDQYTNKNYNETETRRDFLDPFFEAFGWDVSNRAGKSQTYRDVIHEDKVKVGKETKAPDYAFRIGGNRVFFVEAKKPGVNLKEDNLPAFQLRRYGWSAKLGISFLTDFEELAVYDCTRKPNVNDKASTARIEYIHFEDYLNRFDFLYEILNKERIEQGSLEKYIAGTSNKKGTESVDIDFLNSLDNLRTKLASNIAKLNKNLSVRDLNYAVQQIIDRIIFLRAAEDRGIEEYGDLKKTCENKGESFYGNLLKIFEKADGRYNSGLFDFSKDSISSSIEIDNKVIKEIINELYYPLSPYEFSVISVEIIGNAYEQFLGKTITIGKNHSAKIELKPEVRKAGGVYYTPEYIVDYIVANTVGEAIKGKKPEEIANIKILDPACGSGSFLLGAYKYLLNYHIEYYNKIKDRAKFKGSKEDVIKENGDLTIWIKKQILRNNIFGVDIDSNAVEVTKLSLLMKCLEGESPVSIQNNQDLFNERALPSLEDNIKCGNSLIGNDFYESHLDLDDDTLYKINCFDWNSKFRDIMKAGGFDVVIGNPPYVQIQGMEKELKEGYKESNYKNYVLTGDIYQLFFEKSLDVLKAGGIVGMITSNKWMQANYGAITRNYFYKNANVNGVIDLGGGRFQGATVDTSIILYSKNDGEIEIDEPREFKAIKFYDDLSELENIKFGNEVIIADKDKQWLIMNNIENGIFEKVSKFKPLKNWSININRGILTGFNEAFIIDEETKNNIINEDVKSSELIKPLLRGRDIKRYSYNKNGLYLINTHNGIKEKNIPPINIKDYPAIKKHLDKYYKQLEKRQDKGNTPYNLRNCAYLLDFDKPKLIYPETTTSANFYYDEENFIPDKTNFIMTGEHLKYIMAVLSSKAGFYIFYHFYSNIQLGSAGFQYRKDSIEPFPIPEPDKDTESKLVNLVDNIIDLNKKLSSEKNPNTIEMLNTRIQAVDAAIDKIVYSLYNLTDEEIKIIEGA
ncbi:Eco57I restriction-modification methylase domain-containing protein [Brachyspira hyodysenteriae]|uniref:Eco57I restriction-modification methylase domain-containing protein n=1 Tax=Brachyspira hyodysenteriae TaxID=159 RepID=UPI001182313E|nr:N-6 DNA methylase [Brachyspira hyodysenteriae]TVL73512.1 methyltransferase [Brachyspira hyodysenteriae]